MNFLNQELVKVERFVYFIGYENLHLINEKLKMSNLKYLLEKNIP